MHRRALLVVDVQNDFFPDGGGLPVPVSLACLSCMLRARRLACAARAASVRASRDSGPRGAPVRVTIWLPRQWSSVAELVAGRVPMCTTARPIDRAHGALCVVASMLPAARGLACGCLQHACRATSLTPRPTLVCVRDQPLAARIVMAWRCCAPVLRHAARRRPMPLHTRILRMRRARRPWCP